MKTKSMSFRVLVAVVAVILYSCQEPELTVEPSAKKSGTTELNKPSSSAALTAAAVTEAMFDDFNYTSSADALLSSRGWGVREGKGGPGPRGVSWLASNITFVADPANAANKILRLTSTSTGRARTTTQAEIYTPIKYFEGTYAARVKFSDTPATGADGAQVVQTFFTISPYNSGDPQYSELDFEYLSNGGWGLTGPTMWNTSWNSTTVRTSASSNQSYNGWNDLVMVVSGGVVNYYINGVLKTSHTGIYYPRRTMQIDFNQWFIDARGPASSYVEDVDWVYHAKNAALTTAEVNTIVANYKSQSITFTDNVQ
jgi:hypothetical protein